MRFLLDTVIANNTTHKQIRKTFQVEATDEFDARDKADLFIGGNETIIIKHVHSMSDFSHPM